MNALLNKSTLPAIRFIQSVFFDRPHSREDILSIEQWILNMESSFKKCPYPLYQYLENNLYTREIHMDAGHLVCSRIHKDDYFITVLKGICWVINEFENRVVIAPCAFTIKGGAKNILFILQDTVWIDTHKVNANTTEDAEKEIFVDSYQQLDNQLCLVL